MDIILLHIEISEISIPKIFVMIFYLNVGIMYMLQLIFVFS